MFERGYYVRQMHKGFGGSLVPRENEEVPNIRTVDAGPAHNIVGSMGGG
jgi:hypothetical protein